jgi:hypothetical protein
MGGKRSADRARPKDSDDPKPLIEELLQKGYESRLIANELGVKVKKVQAIKARMVLPELLDELGVVAGEGLDTELDTTPAWADPLTVTQPERASQIDKAADWREVEEDDLEGPELDRVGTCNLLLGWLREKGKTSHTIESLGSALDEAQVDASKTLKDMGLKPPIRLRRDSDLYLHRIAMTTVGKPGRGGSSKYRAIRGHEAPQADCS